MSVFIVNTESKPFIIFFENIDPDLIYDSSKDGSRINDHLTNTLSDMNDKDYNNYNLDSSSDENNYHSNTHQISYGYQTTTSSSLESR